MRKAALLVIDVQKGLDDPSLGKRNNPQAESNMASLLSEWRSHKLPIIHIRHCSVEPDSPLRPGLPGNAFKDESLAQNKLSDFGELRFVGMTESQMANRTGLRGKHFCCQT